MPPSSTLYFIAIIPKREVREKITAFKQDFANRFNSTYALKVYPHITLKAPFKFSPNAHAELLRWFSDLHVLQKQFTIQLKDFGAFGNKRNPVVFVQPVVTKELQALQQQLIASFSSVFPGNTHPTDLDFHPHMTIAYRDLSPEMFNKAWNEYKNKSFDEAFEVDAVYVLQHDSKKWNIISAYNLRHHSISI
jgi:2'-5' RNA ligase